MPLARFFHRRQPARAEAAEGEQGEGGGLREPWVAGGGGAATPSSSKAGLRIRRGPRLLTAARAAGRHEEGRPGADGGEAAGSPP